VKVNTGARILGEKKVITGTRILGESRIFWVSFVLGVVLLALSPQVISRYGLLTFSGFLLYVFMSLGLALMWGKAGILSLGQSAFYGLGGYAYGIVGINLMQAQGNTDLAILAGIGVPVATALLLGAVMFYARLKGVYVAILTFVVTLVIQTFLNQTAGAQWAIGSVYLGGDNGLGRYSGTIQTPPNLTLGLGPATVTFAGSDPGFFYTILTLLVVVFLSLRWLSNSRWGHVMAAIREDPDRTETFGHDVRRIQLAVFCLSAALAGLSGLLYVAWGNFITPDVFGVTANILPVIWVAVGGRKSLLGAVLATLTLLWLSQTLATQGNYAFVILGVLLLVVVMVMPEGVVPSLTRLVDMGTRRAYRPSR
jgi:branched-chain amino acid transport system permease protein